MSKVEAQFISEGIADLVFFGSIILAGMVIPDVESTFYPALAFVLIAQSLIGYVLSESGKLVLPHRAPVESGQVDIPWGFKKLWRQVLWPLNLK